MDSSKFAVKLFAADGSDLSSHVMVPVFHSLIQTHAMHDHLMIDVADYDHVPNGPGTLLVTLEANVSTDRGAGRAGLLYVRKHALPGTIAERFRTVLQATLNAAALLENHRDLDGKVKFRTDEFLIRIYDRLEAPNSPETFAAVRGDLESVLKEAFGSTPVTLEYKPKALEAFEVRVRTSSTDLVATVLARVAAHPVASSVLSAAARGV